MSNRHDDPLDSELDRWVDDPTPANLSQLSSAGPDGVRWQRWHRLLRSDRTGDGTIAAPVLDLPAIPPPALGVIARTVVDAWRDPSLRAGLRADPRSVLSGAGVELPAEMEVRAVTMPLTVMPRGSAAGAVLELPLPAATAPPADRSSVGRQLRGTPFEWVLWAAFGPFDAAEAPTARPAIAAPADVGRPRWSWRQAFAPRTLAFAGALAAVAVVLMAAPGVLGPLAGAAVGPAQGVRIVLALACAAGAVLLLLSMRRR